MVSGVARPIDLLIRADYLYPMTEGDPIIAPGEAEDA